MSRSECNENTGVCDRLCNHRAILMRLYKRRGVQIIGNSTLCQQIIQANSKYPSQVPSPAFCEVHPAPVTGGFSSQKGQ